MPLKRVSNHRFEIGDKVYLRPWNTNGETTHEFTEPFVVVGVRLLSKVVVPLRSGDRVWAARCPHYQLRDPDGGRRTASQLELRSKPFD